MGLFFNDGLSSDKAIDMVCCWCGKWTLSSVMFNLNGTPFNPTRDEIKARIQRKEGVFCSPKCIVEYKVFRRQQQVEKTNQQ